MITLPSFLQGNGSEGVKLSAARSAHPTVHRPFSDTCIFPVLASDTLLGAVSRRKILDDIRVLTRAPDDYYDALYKTLIDNFTEFVQIIPVTNESRLASILDEGLLRGKFVLEFYKEEDFDPLIMYALFSAALLFDVGQVVADRWVSIADVDGNFIKNWDIFGGAMQERDGYYRMRRGAGINPWLARHITPLLARQLMGEYAFSWLSGDTLILNMWLALLLDDKEAGGALANVFYRALTRLVEFRNTQGYIMEMDIEILEPEYNSLAEDFLVWLRQRLKRKEDVNKPTSNVQIIKHGITLKLKPLVEKFNKETGKKASTAAIAEQLDKLGMIKEKVKLGTKEKVSQSPTTLFRAKTEEGHAKVRVDPYLSKDTLAFLMQYDTKRMLLHKVYITNNQALSIFPVTKKSTKKLSESAENRRLYEEALEKVGLGPIAVPMNVQSQ